MEIFEAIKAFLFGIVEGITEWLPISSTGHMMLLNQFLPLDVSAAFYDTFLVVIQLGAILAVIILYFHKLNPFSFKKTPHQRRETWGIWAKVVVGSIPAAIVGLLLDDWVESHIMNDPRVSYIVVSAALIVYGIIFIIIERHNQRKLAMVQFDVRSSSAALGRTGALPGRAGALPKPRAAAPGSVQPAQRHGKHARLEPENTMETVSYAQNQPAPVFIEQDRRMRVGTVASPEGQPMVRGDEDPAELDASSAISKVNSFDELSYGRAFVIGIFQSLAVIPGTSRSGSIIIGSMLMGTSRTIATEFAFFLAIPIMLGWSLLKFIRHGFDYTGTEWMIFGIGIVTAFVVSILAIKFLIGYIKRNDFTAFGVYRIIIGLVVLGYFGSLALGLF